MNTNNIDLFIPLVEYTQKYNAKTTYLNVWQLYMYKTYTSFCKHPSILTYMTGIKGANKLGQHAMLFKGVSTDILFSPELLEAYNNCEYKYFSVLLAVTHDGIIASHVNVLIIDKSKRTIYHFEPHGEIKYVDFSILKHKLNRYFPGFKYYPSTGLGPQALEEMYRMSEDIVLQHESGYCQIWCLLFIHLCFNHPNINPYQIIQNLSNENNVVELHFMLMKYLAFIMEIRYQYDSILSHVNDIVTNDNNFICPECQIQLDSYGFYVNHLAEHAFVALP
jgi:hypothetical protein